MVLLLYIMRLAENKWTGKHTEVSKLHEVYFCTSLTQHYSSLTWVFEFLDKSFCLISNANVWADSQNSFF